MATCRFFLKEDQLRGLAGSLGPSQSTTTLVFGVASSTSALAGEGSFSLASESGLAPLAAFSGWGTRGGVVDIGV